MKRIKLPISVRNFENKENIILRDFLALERTTLANERTLFAYIRSSLYLILAGLAFIEFERFASLQWLTYIIFPLSGILIASGIIRYFSLRNKLRRFYEPPKDNQKG